MNNSWNHNIHYHDIVLRASPLQYNTALDVGCGEGLLLRQLSPMYHIVAGIDIDITALNNASAGNSNTNIQFILGDIMEYTFPKNFDLIASIATLHHLPIKEAFIRFRGLLNPGGVLVIIGLYKIHTLADYVYAVAGVPLSRLIRLFKSYREMNAPMQAPNLHSKRSETKPKFYCQVV